MLCPSGPVAQSMNDFGLLSSFLTAAMPFASFATAAVPYSVCARGEKSFPRSA